MKYVKGVYVNDIIIAHPVTGEHIELSVWMNPETQKLFALDQMELCLPNNFSRDPHELEEVRVVFEDTFSGLPK